MHKISILQEIQDSSPVLRMINALKFGTSLTYLG